MLRTDSPNSDIEISIPQGRIRGTLVADTIASFKGVPYARPPTNTLRLEEPESAASWSGVRDATAAGPTAPQSTPPKLRAIDILPIVGTGWTSGDDYLTLNVWTPLDAIESTALLPVMVWIHGGGFTLGSKDAVAHDGTAFARSNVVCVAINYRLGVEGFLPLGPGSTNLGLRDMIAALQWVQQSISAFGGDPGNVTAFGESAGGFAISTLVCSPRAQGLFRRAIIQSGHPGAVLTPNVAQRTTNYVARQLGIDAHADAFRSMPSAAAVKAMQKASRPGAVDLRDEHGYNPLYGISPVAPVIGDDILPENPWKMLASGAGSDIDIAIGCTADEFNFWTATTPLSRSPGFLTRWLMRHVHPQADAVIDLYKDALGTRSTTRAATQAMTDLMFKSGTRRLAELHQGTTHVYEFDWRSPACHGRLGAAHGLDVAFTFNTLDTVTGDRGFAGATPPASLAESIQSLWARYARDGHLPWDPFDSSSPLVHDLERQITRTEPRLLATDFMPLDG